MLILLEFAFSFCRLGQANLQTILLRLPIMIAKSLTPALLLLCLGSFGYAISGNTPTEDKEELTTAESSAITGNSEAGEARYKQSCINCHGAAGKGVASYPKISGQEISYTTSKLETYRDGKKIGPNSSLMIMMAKPLTDEEIANLAAYLKDAKS